MPRDGTPSRRDFIKLTGLGVGAMAFSRLPRAGLAAFPEQASRLASFPEGVPLGRVAVYPNYTKTPIHSQPDENAPVVRMAEQDEVVLWTAEVVGGSVQGRVNRRWAQVQAGDGAQGFIYAADLQPVRYMPNQTVNAIPSGKPGFWAEVTVPYVDMQLAAPPIGPGVKDLIQAGQPVRLYYGQVAWIDMVGSDSAGNVLYRFNESAQHGWGPGDLLIGDGAGFHMLTDDDIAPINPHVDPATKTIVVDSTPTRQVLSCLEGKNEVYFCRVSTGYFSQDPSYDFSTPTGPQSIWWKTFSIHMGASFKNAASGYDTMGVPWLLMFNSGGAAIHGTFWHNDFGVPRSHGCVNVSPEDAKWIFRWSGPGLTLDQSELRLQYPNVGGSYSTSVTVDLTKVGS